MSNINDFLFAKHLDQFKIKVLDPQAKRVDDARKIMENPDYKWDNDDQKNRGAARYMTYKAWLQFYQAFYDAGMQLVLQHEAITNKMAKWYGRWYDEVSNEGKMETEIMSMQADAMNEIFSEMWKELKPLNLDIKPPQALNLT